MKDTGRISTIPKYSKIVVIGGGPAGSMAASILARENLQTTLFEKSKFPRYHIGESLLNMLPLFEFIDIQQKIEKHGFVKKYEGFFRVKHGEKAGHVDLRINNPHHNSTYQVIRSEFDKLLLDHAKEMGANVFEETSITKVNFAKDTPTSVEWRNKDGITGITECDFLIDASGLVGLLANNYLKNRHFQETFANIAIGSYWDNYKDYIDDEGIVHDGAFSMEALIDGSGWLWAIPLHNGTLSVGAVIHRNTFAELRNKLKNDEAIYKYALSLCRDIHPRIKDSKQVEPVRLWKDYSYVSSNFSGPRYRMIGDAAGFIDPLFSSGVHLACFGALSAAASICASIKGEETEEEAGKFHDKCLRTAYTRFVLIVAGIYRQIQTPYEFVLPKVGVNDLQNVFHFIQPIVSGNIDINNQNLTEERLQQSIEYAKDIALQIYNVKESNALVQQEIKELAASPTLGMAVDEKYSIDGKYIRMARGSFGLTKALQ